MRQTPWETGLAARRTDQPTECGVQLPLLAPMLTGLRLRSGQHGLEFALPNPSGGRGVYVASWTVVTGFATPSLHDTLLIGRLSVLDRIDPAAVREAARSVARDGHAGIQAAEAACEVDALLRTASLRLGATLLMSLARRAGFTKPEQAARCLSRDGFHRLSHRLGWHAPTLAEGLRDLSVRYVTIVTGNGLANGPSCGPSHGTVTTGAVEPGQDSVARDGSGRWGRLAALVRQLRAALAEEQCNSHGTDGALLGRIILAADQCLKTADRLLPEIDAMLADPLPLLELWRDRRRDRGARTADWLEALETAFDGWDRVCLLWLDADTQRRRQAVIGEIALLTGTLGHGDSATACALEEPFMDGNRGRHLLARNERIRARELRLETDAA